MSDLKCYAAIAAIWAVIVAFVAWSRAMGRRKK